MTRRFAVAAACSMLALAVLVPGDARAQEDTTCDCAQEDSAQAREDTVEQEEANGSNPFEGDEAAIAEGKKLWMKYNCYGCHGTSGGGGMGPSLVDGKWRYGSSDAEIFQSITEGRPAQGMPAFGEQIPEEERWKLIAYLRSLMK